MNTITRAVLVIFFIQPIAVDAQESRTIVFPVIGATGYRNDFGDPRVGHTHEGNDIFASKMRPIVSTVDGTVGWVTYPEASWGYSVSIVDADGYEYRYLHINNDTPGTDDGKGGGTHAYAPDIKPGTPVVKGQLLGWNGDSGNAERTPPHIHFEIRKPDGTPINPYFSLQASDKVASAADYPPLPGEILPYGSQFQGGASIATANLDTDPDLEVVTGAGPGGGPHVRVFDRKSNTAFVNFFAYPTGFRGGVDVATGDVTGDGIAEIITAAGPGGGPHVRVFDRFGTPIAGFFPYAETFRGGVRVSVADMDGDGKAEIITGPGKGGGPHVRIFSGTGVPMGSFFAYTPTFTGGIDVAASSATAVSPGRIITGAGPGGGPHVRIFDRFGTPLKDFFAYDAAFRGGVRIAAANIRSDVPFDEIVTVPASSGGPHVKLYSIDGVELSYRMEFEPWWRGSFDIAAGNDLILVSTGQSKRRTSVRESDHTTPPPWWWFSR